MHTITSRLLSIALVFVAGTVHAAPVISGSFTDVSNTSINLSTLGTTDWAAFWRTGNSGANNYSPSFAFLQQEKDGGTAIGTLARPGNNGATTYLNEAYTGWNGTWTGGNASLTTPDTSSASNWNNLVISRPNTNDGPVGGFTLNTTILAGQSSGTLSLYVFQFDSDLDFGASITGGNTYTSNLAQTSGFSKKLLRYDIVFSGVTADSTIAVTLGADTATSNRGIGFAAATLAAVPEPATFALLGLGGLAFLVARRRQA